MIKHVKDLQVGDVFFYPEIASVFTVVAVGNFYNVTSNVSGKTYLAIPLILVRKDGRNFQFAMYDRFIPVIGQSTILRSMPKSVAMPFPLACFNKS